MVVVLQLCNLLGFLNSRLVLEVEWAVVSWEAVAWVVEVWEE